MHPTTTTAARALCALALLFAVATPALAQTNTPTVTPTSTPTPTPTVEAGGSLAQGYTCGAGGTCPTPPCDVPITRPAQAGHKTVTIGARGQAPTVKLMGRPVLGWLAPEVLISSMTGASCDTTAANCIKEFDGYYDEVFLRVTACPTPAAIDGWLRSEPR
jgi:hypothetical protein